VVSLAAYGMDGMLRCGVQKSCTNALTPKGRQHTHFRNVEIAVEFLCEKKANRLVVFCDCYLDLSSLLCCLKFMQRDCSLSKARGQRFVGESLSRRQFNGAEG
jgi:hypothetical protein